MQKLSKTRLRQYTILYGNANEYHNLKSEIFSSQIYRTKNVGRKPIILDCGSHIGLSILYFKDSYPDSIIYGFEPNPVTYKVLEESIFLNNLMDITIENSAVDTSSGETTLHTDIEDDWLSTSGYIEGSWQGTQPTKPIKVVTKDINTVIDEIIQIHTRGIDILKLDIEGYEFKILIHLKERLKSIRNLIVEYHPNNRKNFPKMRGTLEKYYRNITYFQEGKVTTNPNLLKLFIINCSN